MEQVIICHEDWQTMPYIDFLQQHFGRQGFGQLPAMEPVGEIKAVVNQGRWLVRCPTDECCGAICVSRRSPIYMCPHCANEGNDGKWLAVMRPPDYAEIEMELLKRPARNPFHAVDRNWEIHDTLDGLKEENRIRGWDVADPVRGLS